ncbi:MAG: hypothetical protein ACO1NZ_01505 [Adhaeribacter sp.]
MISYFKRILLSRLLVLVLLFLALRLPLILLGIPVTLPELKYMVLGERLSEGFVLYRDVYDTTAPLSAALFWSLDMLFGRNILAYRGLAALLLLLQGLRLNATFNHHGVLPEKTYLPALLYLLFGSIFFELDTLSPLLLGMTFLIFALAYLITPPREGVSNPNMFKAGFLLGIAALCHLPLMFFLVLAFFGTIFFAFNAFRSFLLLVCGFLFPYSVVFTFFLYAGALPNFIQYNLLSAWDFRLTLLLPALDLLKIVTAPLLLLAFFTFYGITRAPGLNYHIKVFQFMLLWLPVALVTAIAGQHLSMISWLLFLAPLAYFGANFFLRSRSLWLTEPFFLVLLGLTLVLRYNGLIPDNPYSRLDVSRLAVQSGPQYEVVKNARILVLGDDFNYYAANKAATPYVNWQLAQEDFGQLHTYYAIFKILRNISASRPDYIIDQAKLLPDLQYKAPQEFRRYERLGNTPVYRRR